MTKYRGLRSSPDMVPYGSEGLFLAREYAIAIDDPDCPVLVELEVTMVDGQPECAGLHCLPRSGETLSSEMLRRVRLRHYLRESATVFAIRSTFQQGVEVISAVDTGDEPVLARAQRRQITDEFLREVASVYMAAKTKRVAAVMIQLHGSRATANRWVNEAKRRGFIQEAATEEDAGRAKGLTLSRPAAKLSTRQCRVLVPD